MENEKQDPRELLLERLIVEGLIQKCEVDDPVNKLWKVCFQADSTKSRDIIPIQKSVYNIIKETGCQDFIHISSPVIDSTYKQYYEVYGHSYSRKVKGDKRPRFIITVIPKNQPQNFNSVRR